MRIRAFFPTPVSLAALTLSLAVLNSPLFAADHNLAGTWKATFTTQNGQTIESTLKLKQEGDKVTGKVSVADFELPISEGKIAGNAISFTVAVDRDDLKFTSKYKGTVASDTIKGKIHSDRDGQDHEYDWNATREKAAATSSNVTGLWKWVLVTDSGDSHDLSLKL